MTAMKKAMFAHGFRVDGFPEADLILADSLMAGLAGFGGLAKLRLDGLLIAAFGDFGQLAASC